MVKPKKYLGQHFLKDLNIAQKIVNSLDADSVDHVIEIGPGTGVLTQYLLLREFTLHVIEIDEESTDYLKKHFPDLEGRILNENFLKLNLSEMFKGNIAVIGNFPYNISTQILFKVLDFRYMIPEVCGMFQKEVAERISSGPGSKIYGILSVLIQAFYDVDYLFTVSEHVFNPPPKVKSAVIKLKRKDDFKLNCNEDMFFRIVKTAFNQRRKTLRNSLKSIVDTGNMPDEIFSKRPEQLSNSDFIFLTKLIESKLNQKG